MFVQLVRKVRFRLNAAVWAAQSLAPAAGALGAYASILLVLKLASPELARWAHLALLLLPAALLAGAVQARRRGLFFTESETIETLDHLYRNDGSLSSWHEAPLRFAGAGPGESAAAALSARLPRPRPAYYARRLAPAALYLAVAFAVPPRPPAPAAEGRGVAAAVTQPLLDKLAENAALLPEAKVEELRQAVEEVAEDPRGLSREQWEAAEELDRRLDEAAEQGRAQVRNLAAQLDRMGRQIADQQAGAVGADASDPVKAQLQEAVKQAGAQGGALPANLKSGLDKLAGQLNQGQSSAADLQSQLDALRKECAGLSPGGGLPGLDPAEGEGEGPGKGGVSRGRGDAALVFGEEKSLAGARFKDQEIANKFLDPGQTVDLGITPLRPEVNPGRFSPGVVRDFGDQRGAGVSRSRVGPGQKDAVERYFRAAGGR